MIGLDAKTYYGTAGSSAANELDILREVNTDLNDDDIVSAYRNSQWKSHEAGQTDGTVSLTVQNKTSDPGYQALRNAKMNKELIALKILDEASGEGLDADFAVLTMGRPEPIDGVIEITFTCGVNTSLREPVWVT